jgi:hypothetical protein
MQGETPRKSYGRALKRRFVTRIRLVLDQRAFEMSRDVAGTKRENNAISAVKPRTIAVWQPAGENTMLRRLSKPGEVAATGRKTFKQNLK